MVISSVLLFRTSRSRRPRDRSASRKERAKRDAAKGWEEWEGETGAEEGGRKETGILLLLVIG